MCLNIKDIYGKSYELNHLIVMKLYLWQYDHALFFLFYRCLCSLARQIGFSEKAVEIFKLEKTLGLYRQVVRLFLVFQLLLHCSHEILNHTSYNPEDSYNSTTCNLKKGKEKLQMEYFKSVKYLAFLFHRQHIGFLE